MVQSPHILQGITMEVNARFDRLEAKIDKLVDVMVKLVEIDTKMDGLTSHNVIQDNRLNKHSSTIDKHSIKLATVAKTSGANEWFIRILIAGVVSAVFYAMRG